MKCFCFLLVSTIIYEITGDYYCAIDSLQQLLSHEEFLVEHLENYMEAEHYKNQPLRNFINQAELEAIKLTNNTKDLYANPIHEWRALKRITRDWYGQAEATLKPTNEKEYDKRLTAYEFANNFTKPILKDLQGAAKGISRLQNFYKLETAHFADGRIMGKKVSNAMTSTDCYTLGWGLNAEKQYKSAVTWLLEARSRLAKEQTAGKTNDSLRILRQENIFEALIPAVLKSGNTKLALLYAKEYLALHPEDQTALSNFQKVLKRLKAERFDLQKGFVRQLEEEADTLGTLTEKTCRGALRQTPKEKRVLRCRYESFALPYCKIAPFKKEELSLDPFVAVYYEAIYDSEIKYIIQAGSKHVKRSLVGGHERGRISDSRTSKQIWLYYDEHAALQNLVKRLMHVTGLTLTTAEPLQVLNYGIGGHYVPHYDFLAEKSHNLRNNEDRILTALFYINDVELGGSTAFPYLKLAVPPIKRSLLVWYNLHRSLELDYRMKHAGCPVIKGSKWVCNEWFSSSGQEFRRPCELQPDGYKSFDFYNKY